MALAIRCRARSWWKIPLTETASRSFLVLTSSTATALVTRISMVANTAVATRVPFFAEVPPEGNSQPPAGCDRKSHWHGAQV